LDEPSEKRENDTLKKNCLGLGMHLVNELAVLNQGTIEVIRQLNQGAIKLNFKFDLSLVIIPK